MPTELTVVIPTYNEADNIDPLVSSLEAALQGLSWEVIFVDDDSPDGTYQVVRDIAKLKSHVRIMQRIGRRGLSSATIEGMLACASSYIAVMDADMQHDESLLPVMLKTLKTQDIDLVNASRYMSNNSDDSGLTEHRAKISQFATKLSHVVLQTPLTDPMSGFFMLKRSLLDDVAHHLYGQGFKILLDICATSADIRTNELSYTMRSRQLGQSKLDYQVALEFLLLLAYKLFGRIVPSKFFLFALVGVSGVFVNLAVLGAMHQILLYPYAQAQTIAIAVAMTSNFILNNRFTFPNQRLRGKKLLPGLISFYVTCSIGAVIGIAVGSFIHNLGITWWIAGLCSVVVSAFWNYSLSSIITWGKISKKNNL